MNECRKCMKIGGVLVLAFGVLFLLRDLGIWSFWNIQWWTVLFVLIGVIKLGSSSCSDCQGKKGKCPL